MSGCHY